jgi:hypothetical protein
VLAIKSIEEIDADTLVAAGIADIVRWPIAAQEIATALNHCLALGKPEAGVPFSSARAAHSLLY